MKKWFKKIGKKFYGKNSESQKSSLKEQSASVKINKVISEEEAKNSRVTKTIENPK